MTTPPKFNLTHVERVRDRLLERVLTPLVTPDTLIVDGDALNELADALHSGITGTINRDALFESIRYLAGHPFTAKDSAILAWRLAGNMKRLKSGQSVLPWLRQTEPEWLPLQVLKATAMRNNRNRLGYDLNFRVLAGTSCPMTLSVFWSNEQLRWLSSRIGFSKPWGKFPYKRGTEIVGLRLLVHVDPKRSRHAPYFLACEDQPPSFTDWNRKEVLRRRMHIEPCPNSWTHPCRNCAVGYLTCQAAVHKETYELRGCHECGKDNQPFDPESRSDRCVACTYKLNTRNR